MIAQPTLTSPEGTPSTGVVRNVLFGRSNVGALIQSLITKFAVLGVNAGTGILVARALLPAGRGEMAAMIMWAGFLTSAMTLGIPSALIYNVRRFPGRTKGLAGAALVLASLLGVGAALLGFLLVPMWLHDYPAEVVRYAQWFLISSPVPIILLVGRAALESQGDFSGSNTTLWATPALTLAGLAGLMLTKQLNPVTAGLAYVLPGIPIALWMFGRLRRTTGPNLSDFTANIQDLARYGARSYGIDLVAALALQADQVLIAGFVTATSMGIYLAASNVARMLSVFPLSIVMVLFPRAAGLSLDEIQQLTSKAVRICNAFALVGGVITVILGPSLLSGLYGPQYLPAAPVLRLLVVEAVLSGSTQVMAQALMASGRPGVVTVVQTVGIGASIALMVVLVPTYGVAGAAFSMAVSAVLRFAATLLCFPLVLGIAPPALLITMDDLRYLRGKVISLRNSSASCVLEGQAQHAS